MALLLAMMPGVVLAIALGGCKGKENPPSQPASPTSSGPSVQQPSRESPADRPPVKLSLTPLASRMLGPADSAQTVAYTDEIKVTVPGGLLRRRPS